MTAVVSVKIKQTDELKSSMRLLSKLRIYSSRRASPSFYFHCSSLTTIRHYSGVGFSVGVVASVIIFRSPSFPAPLSSSTRPTYSTLFYPFHRTHMAHRSLNRFRSRRCICRLRPLLQPCSYSWHQDSPTTKALDQTRSVPFAPHTMIELFFLYSILSCVLQNQPI
jgi:hypothetical protein